VRFLTPAMLTIILLVVVGGLVVGYVAKTMLATEAPPPEERRNYPMAIADLKPGTVITEAHLAQGPWLASQTKPTFARSDTVLLGRVVKNALKAATPIDTLDLYPPGEGLPLDIGVGMRAVEIDLDGGATMAGLAQPGEYLDVHFTPNGYDDDRYRGGFTMTMFKGVKVLAVNRSGRTSATALGRSSNTVTLELTPEQANILLLAQQKGRLNLIYTPDGPGNGGVAVADEDKAFFEEILGLAPREEEKPFVTEVYYGSGRNTHAFDKDGKRLSGDSYRGFDSTDGIGNRLAPMQNGGQEPAGWGSGYYRGIDNNAGPNAGTPARLIPSPQANPQGNAQPGNTGVRTYPGI
jgi:pilus assembly protein CpaB